jgi:putative ABC transport system permease protein
MLDFRDAWRALRASPLLSAVAVLSLALGMGANTAIFSILNSLLLKPLPVREPHRLVALGSNESEQDSRVSYAVWREIRDQGLLPDAFAWATDRLASAEAGDSGSLDAIWASRGFFDVLGVRPVAGRGLVESDARPGGGADGPVAVISHGFWRRRYGGAPDALGRTLTIERVAYTIVGVAPPGFFGLEIGLAFDVLLPLETELLLDRVPPRLENRYWPWLTVMARLPPGATAETVTAALRLAQPQIRELTMPEYDSAEHRDAYLREPWRARPAATGSSHLRSRYGAALTALLGLVGLVMLVACANIANLMLARTAARQYEFSVRLALGASRRRLARQLLAESLLLAAAGAAVGLALAQWGSRLLVEQLSTWAYTASLDLSPDWRVLGVTGAVTVATAVLSGTAPAFRAARAEPVEALKGPVRSGITPGGAGLGGTLVVVQIALSLMLVAGAGLFLRSFTTLVYRDLGFERDRVLVAIVDASRSAASADSRLGLSERLRQAAAALPDVESAAASTATPLGSIGNVRFTPLVQVPGGARPVRLLVNPVSPDWFRTFGTRLEAGRDFEAGDLAGAPRVAIVNQVFARRYFDGANPVGRTIVQVGDADDRRVLEIVGLAADAAFTSVREPAQPTIYTPLAQGVDENTLASFPHINISVRAAHGPPARLARALAAALADVDPGLSISFLTVAQQLDVFYIRERLLALLSGFFGALALLLAALGVYGVTMHAVNRRRTEIGIRMALGASAPDVLRLVLGRLVWLVSLGVAGGTLASFWTARYLGTLLFEIDPRDPLTLVGAAVVLALVAGAAGLLPARRAAGLDPAIVLREGPRAS